MNQPHRRITRRRRRAVTIAAIALGTCLQFGCLPGVLATIGVTFF